MSISEKQLIANQENAKKGGVKTEEGKMIVRHNALKHGLLAKEIVITQGDGAESQEEFDALLTDLQDQFNPEGSLEAMLVEKIAVSYWRLRRAYRYEVGLIRQELDMATERYYAQTSEHTTTAGRPGTPKTVTLKNRYNTDEEIDKDIRQAQEDITVWQKNQVQLNLVFTESKDLKEIYDLRENWKELSKLFADKLDNLASDWPETIRKALNKVGLADDQIWKAHIKQGTQMELQIKQNIAALERKKLRNRLNLEVIKMKGSIPAKNELDHLLRYESTIERQFYKAMDQLERLQRLRAGDNVPPPVKINMEVNTGNGS